MRPYIVLRYVGLVLTFLSAFMLLSSVISYVRGDGAFLILFYSAVVTLLFGVFPMVFVPPTRRISANEGLAIVVAGWLFSCLFGALPYVLWAGEFTLTNAWFESVSGFTTTGSSILMSVEKLPHGLLFWRAATHWIGGLGILMFALAVLPAMNRAGLVLFRIEVSSLARENFRQNIRGTLRILLVVYGGLTAAEILALLAAGMDLFDAVTHSFATIATGGFSPRNLSVAAYDSPLIETIIIVFMLLSGIHFGLLFATLVERSGALWKSGIVRYYVAAMAVGVAAVTVSVHGRNYEGWLESLRFSAFQVASLGTSTGFASADSSVWPPVAQILLMFFALQCACAGSTSGGIKVDRFLLFIKGVVKQVRIYWHPRAIIPVRVDGRVVDDEALSSATLYILLYLMIVAAGGLCLVVLGVDPLSAFTGAIATTGNVGPGMGTLGSLENFADLPALGKWVLTGTMLLGRLEIYGFIMLLSPALWRLAAPVEVLTGPIRYTRPRTTGRKTRTTGIGRGGGDPEADRLSRRRPVHCAVS